MANVLNDEAEAFQNRLLDGRCAYVWLDALCPNIGQDRRICWNCVLAMNGPGQSDPFRSIIASSGDFACKRSMTLSSISGLRGFRIYSTTGGHLNQ